MTDSLDGQLANVLGALSMALADRIRNRTDAAIEIGGAAAAALVSLAQFLEGKTMEDLANVTGLTHSGAVRLVDRLEAGGFVVRKPGKDGRSRAISLTTSGRAASRRIRSARTAALDAALAGTSHEDRSTLLRLLSDLIDAVTRQRLARRTMGDTDVGGWMCRLCDFDACGRRDDRCPAAAAATRVST